MRAVQPSAPTCENKAHGIKLSLPGGVSGVATRVKSSTQEIYAPRPPL